MTQFNKRMQQIFNLPDTIDTSEEIESEFLPLVQEDRSSDLQLSEVLSHDLKEDYEKVRDNIDLLIQKGVGAVDDMLAIARVSEKARDFEVAGNMIKSMVDASKELLDLQKTMRELSGVKSETTTNIKNAVFVGSTTEFLKMRKEAREAKEGDI